MSDFGKIKDEAIHYFLDLYKKDWGEKPRISNLFSSWIEELENYNLEKPFSVEEVRNAIICMGNDKFLRLNGFSMFFYQECWDII